MIRRILRLGFIAGLLGGASFALFKFVQSRRAAQELPPASDWLPQHPPSKPLVEPDMLHGVSLAKDEPVEDEPEQQDETPPAPAGWVEPDGAGCPASHPVKGKLSSGIFHLPGMLAYERTLPDRCYVDEAAAEADGLRKAKR